jgi:hypothetical protein
MSGGPEPDASLGSGGLAALARLAEELGAPTLAAEARAVAERLGEGRFYVVCVGQFKRGKSTLLNALIGEPVLPTGVVPVTSVVTVIRHGERLAARVRHDSGDWEECEPQALATYVTEEQNPGNEMGVAGVEVFAPSALLESGLCLVDTPGIGSVSATNTETARAFVPHVDAALIVLGGDPPIAGDELALIEARISESRGQLEAELRARLRELVEPAERALERARQARAAGAAATGVELQGLGRLRAQLSARPASRPPELRTAPAGSWRSG